jgi:CRP-like cAMP-binding protein
LTLDRDVARLSDTRPFDLMPREAVQLLVFSCGKTRVKAGEALFLAGEAGEAGYFVHSGAIELSPAGDRSGARRVGAGVLIGESALYASVARQVEERALEDSVVTRVPRETFRRVLTEFPAAAAALRAVLAARTRDLVERLDASRAASLDRPPDLRSAS